VWLYLEFAQAQDEVQAQGKKFKTADQIQMPNSLFDRKISKKN
jgi:hypothetical protein